MNLTIQYKKTKDLIPYARNSRTHSDEQILQIASSIKEFGFTNPVLVDNDGGIIAGHGRVMAAKKLNINEVPTIELIGLSEMQKKAYIIADNKLALNSGWDNELLKLEFDELKDLNFDLTLLGFSLDELTNLIDPLLDEDKLLKDEDYVSAFSIIIDCKNENEQEKIFNELNEKGYSCRVQSL